MKKCQYGIKKREEKEEEMRKQQEALMGGSATADDALNRKKKTPEEIAAEAAAANQDEFTSACSFTFNNQSIDRSINSMWSCFLSRMHSELKTTIESSVNEIKNNLEGKCVIQWTDESDRAPLDFGSCSHTHIHTYPLTHMPTPTIPTKDNELSFINLILALSIIITLCVTERISFVSYESIAFSRFSTSFVSPFRLRVYSPFVCTRCSLPALI